MAIAGSCAALGAFAAWALLYRVPSPQPLPWAANGTRVSTRPVGTKPGLWILAIGVSRYADASLALQFADADARAVAQAVQEQKRAGLYAEVHSEVLVNEAVTRQSVIEGIERIRTSAGRDDVVMIFIAGHGVREPGGGYYFLPSPADPSNLAAAGVRLADLDELVGGLARAVRAVVVLLDTCHAGALRVGGLAASDLAEEMKGRESLFVLAATQAGEQSSEQADLRHGSFTFALLQGLEGAADANSDGLLSASELFGYVAHQVPLLSGGRQHPYHKLEGGDLVLGAVAGTEPSDSASPVSVGAAAAAANSVGVLAFRNLRADPTHDWMGEALRIAFNTELSKVGALRVYSPEAIDRADDTGGGLAAARRLGLRTLISGSFQILGDTIRIDAEILDPATGMQTGSGSVRGALADFFDLEKRLVLELLRRLEVRLSPAEGRSIETETNTSVDAFHLLLEAEGIVDTATPTAPPPTARDDSPSQPISWGFVSVAAAADLDLAAEVRAMLESYRQALMRKDLDAIAPLYASFSPRQREALAAYLKNAVDLEVELVDVEVVAGENSAEISFLRRDRFSDRVSGKPVRLEVRLSKTVVRDGDRWRFAEPR